MTICSTAWSSEQVSTKSDPIVDPSTDWASDAAAIFESVPSLLHDAAQALVGARGPVVKYDAGWLKDLPPADGGPEFSCLAQALYFEARGETVKGQFAVAEVILNRRDSGLFPSSVCDVVHQGTGRLHQCQFSYICDGKPEVITEKSAYNRVAKIARLMLDGAPRALTDGALYYHTAHVKPRWSQRFAMTTRIGLHRFYRR